MGKNYDTHSTYNDYHGIFNKTFRIYFVTFMYFPSPVIPITRTHLISLVEMCYVTCFCLKLKNNYQNSHYKIAYLGKHHHNSMILFAYQFNHWSLFLFFSSGHFFSKPAKLNVPEHHFLFLKHRSVLLFYMYHMHAHRHTQTHTYAYTG